METRKKVQSARCPKCEGLAMVSVIPVDKEGVKEFAKLMVKGYTVSLEEMPDGDFNWCEGHKIESDISVNQLALF